MALYKSKQKVTILPIEIKDWIIKYNSIHYLTIEIILNVNVAQILESDKTVLYQIKKIDNTILASFTHTLSNINDYNFNKFTIAVNKNKTTYDSPLTDTSYLDKNFFNSLNDTTIDISDVETDISLYMYIKNNSGNDTEYKEISNGKKIKKIKSSQNLNLITRKNDFGNGNNDNIYNDLNNPSIYINNMTFLTNGIKVDNTDQILFKMSGFESSLQNITSYTNNYVSPSTSLLEYSKIEIELKYLNNNNLLDLTFGLGHDATNTNLIYRNFNTPTTPDPKIYIFSKTTVYSDLKNSIFRKFTDSGLLNLFNFSDEEITNSNDKIIKITLTAKTKGMVYVNVLQLTSGSYNSTYKQFNSTTFLISLKVFYTNPYPTPLRLENYDFVDTQQISVDAILLDPVYTCIELMDIYDLDKNLKTFQIDTYLQKNDTSYNLSSRVKINKTSFHGLQSSLNQDFGMNLSKTATSSKTVNINIPFFEMFTNISIVDVYISNRNDFGGVQGLLNFTLTYTKPTFVNGKADLSMTFTPTTFVSQIPNNTQYPVCVNITFSNGMLLSFGAKRGITSPYSDIIYTIVP